jgi:hypothetical protein
MEVGDESDDDDQITNSKVNIFCQKIDLPPKLHHPNAECFLIKCPDLDIHRDKKTF